MMRQTKTGKVGEIELFRFLFSIAVLLRHASYLTEEQTKLPFSGGALAVEFFFIVSGYLLANSALKIGTAPTAIGKETRQFLKKKLSSFFTEHIIAWVIGFLFVIYIFALNYTRAQLVDFALGVIWEPLLLLSTGLRVVTVNSVVWYLSSLIVCMAILYPLLRKYPDITVNLIAPLLAVFTGGYLLRNHETLLNPSKWLGVFYKGTVRAMGEICLGIIVYQAVTALRKVSLNRFAATVLTLVKWACYLLFVLYLWDSEPGRLDFTYTLIIAVAIGLSFSEMTLDTGIFNHRVCYFLGRLSLPLYLSHFYYAKNLAVLFGDRFSTKERLLIYVGLSVCTAFFVMFAASLCRKISPKLQRFWKKLFLKPSEGDQTDR